MRSYACIRCFPCKPILPYKLHTYPICTNKAVSFSVAISPAGIQIAVDYEDFITETHHELLILISDPVMIACTNYQPCNVELRS